MHFHNSIKKITLIDSGPTISFILQIGVPAYGTQKKQDFKTLEYCREICSNSAEHECFKQSSTPTNHLLNSKHLQGFARCL